MNYWLLESDFEDAVLEEKSSRQCSTADVKALWASGWLVGNDETDIEGCKWDNIGATDGPTGPAIEDDDERGCCETGGTWEGCDDCNDINCWDRPSDIGIRLALCLIPWVWSKWLNRYWRVLKCLPQTGQGSHCGDSEWTLAICCFKLLTLL